MKGLQKVEQLIIADGTPYRTLVWDVRGDYQWAQPVNLPVDRNNRRVIYHHTAVYTPDLPFDTHLGAMQTIADTGQHGLPYNFVLYPGPERAIYYVNDVDQAWPHTYGHNARTAICFAGNYENQRPQPECVFSGIRLAWALANMWGLDIAIMCHCDVGKTVCPGRYLRPFLTFQSIPG